MGRRDCRVYCKRRSDHVRLMSLCQHKRDRLLAAQRPGVRGQPPDPEARPADMTQPSHSGAERRLQIAIYHTNLPEVGRKVGGVEIAVHRLANALVDLGMDDITVLSTTAAPSDARYESERFLGSFPSLYRGSPRRDSR